MTHDWAFEIAPDALNPPGERITINTHLIPDRWSWQTTDPLLPIDRGARRAKHINKKEPKRQREHDSCLHLNESHQSFCGICREIRHNLFKPQCVWLYPSYRHYITGKHFRTASLTALLSIHFHLGWHIFPLYENTIENLDLPFSLMLPSFTHFRSFHYIYIQIRIHIA